jgi:DNA repair photolyase
MKTATVRELKEELSHCSSSELLDLCLKLSKFKKENKELLTYLLYESANESRYIETIKSEVTDLFDQINYKNYYYIKKSARKILRLVKKYIRYSKQKETEVELLMHFCAELKNIKPSIKNNVTLQNLFNRQINLIQKTIQALHPDLQYDYEMEIDLLLK